VCVYVCYMYVYVFTYYVCMCVIMCVHVCLLRVCVCVVYMCVYMSVFVCCVYPLPIHNVYSRSKFVVSATTTIYLMMLHAQPSQFIFTSQTVTRLINLLHKIHVVQFRSQFLLHGAQASVHNALNAMTFSYGEISWCGQTTTSSMN